MIYARDNALNKVNVINCGSLTEEFEFECSACTFEINSEKYCIVCIYRSQGGVESFLQKATDLLVQCSRQAQHVYFCGDLNIHYETDNDEKKLLVDFFSSVGLTEHSAEPTRDFTNINGHRSISKIDYLATNNVDSIVRTEVINANLGDHFAIIQTIKIQQKITVPEKPVAYRCFSDFHLDVLRQNFLNISFDYIYGSCDVDYLYHEISSMICWAVQVSCPVKSKNRNNINKRKNTWITADLLKRGNALKDLFWLTKHYDSPVLRQNYKLKKTEYKKDLSKAKRENNNRIITQSQNKQKTVWKIINAELGRSKKDHKIILSENTVTIESPKAVANVFAEYFQNETEISLRAKFGDNRSRECTLSRNRTFSGSFRMSEVTPQEVLKTISLLKNKKSCGIDQISVRVLKCISESVCEPIAHLANVMFLTQRFPSELKTGIITPVYKKGERNCVANYRPVTVLSVFSKVLERLLYARMVEFADKYKLISDCQHGFRAGRSTESAAAGLVDFVYKRMDQGDYVAGLFFDLSRAFDSLDHNFFLKKLVGCGFRDIAELARSFLNFRRFCVKVEGELSDSKNLDIGVPQGSVLGPLFYLIYVNELPDYIDCDYLGNFADDCSTVVSASTLGELEVKVNRCIADFSCWCARNNLVLNVEKTVIVNFRSSPRKPALSIDNVVISDDTKFLGTVLDQFLDWHSQVQHTCKKLNQSFFAILKMRDMVDRDALVTMYYSMFYCYLMYNVILWGNSSGAHRVFVSQKRVIRLIFNMKSRDTCRLVFKEKGIMTLPSIYIYKTLLYAKKNIGKYETGSTYHSYDTRSAHDLMLDFHKLSKFENSPYYMGKKLYNKLPLQVRHKDYKNFKNDVKDLLLKGGYYSIQEYLDDSF